jgi:hypothetical protein
MRRVLASLRGKPPVSDENGTGSPAQIACTSGGFWPAGQSFCALAKHNFAGCYHNVTVFNMLQAAILLLLARPGCNPLLQKGAEDF